MIEPSRIVNEIRRRLRFRRTDLSATEGMVIFVGNPRSGTTLVRSLLNAHPQIMIANEVNVLHHVTQGKSWKNVLARIVDSEQQFAANPVWTGYQYSVPAEPDRQRASEQIRIIGDKKAGSTAKQIADHPESLNQLLTWSQLPVHFIHCVRHPLDVIATKTRRNQASVPENIQRYFRAERAALAVADQVASQRFIRLCHEELIQEPKAVLERLLTSIGLDLSAEYVGACESVIYDQPHQSRHRVNWSATCISEVERRVRDTPHLNRYLTAHQLLLHEPAQCVDSKIPDAA